MELNATYGGPAIRKTVAANPSEIFTRLHSLHPSLSRDALIEAFVQEIKEDEELVTACIKYFGWHAWQGLNRRTAPKPYRPKAPPSTEDQRVVVEIAQKLRRVVISSILMPNGKTFAECTGTEVAKVSKFGAAVAKIVGRRKVGSVLDEKALSKLWKQNQ
jgi:hypothetical protein